MIQLNQINCILLKVDKSINDDIHDMYIVRALRQHNIKMSPILKQIGWRHNYRTNLDDSSLIFIRAENPSCLSSLPDKRNKISKNQGQCCWLYNIILNYAFSNCLYNIQNLNKKELPLEMFFSIVFTVLVQIYFELTTLLIMFFSVPAQNAQKTVNMADNNTEYRHGTVMWQPNFDLRRPLNQVN